MNLKIDILENVLLKIQSGESLEKIWKIFLEFLGFNNIRDDSYLIVKSPFNHKKLYLKDNEIVSDELSDNEFSVDENILGKRRYVFDLENKRIYGHWTLTNSEVEFSVKFIKEEKIKEIESFNEINLLIIFLVNHINIFLHIYHLNMHSIKDDLTLLYNQNYLKSFIEREINRAKRYNLHFSVVFFDLDYLKAINEKHGHLVGTEVLKEVSRILSSSVRNIDVVARFGGDEFVIVLLDSDTELALQICQRLRIKINNNLFLAEDGLNLKVSGCFGISNFPKDGDNVKDLIKKADIAMYEVKGSGKDGIKVYTGE